MIEIISKTKIKISTKKVETLAKEILLALSRPNLRVRQKSRLKKDLVIVFVANAEMKKLNHHFRDKNKVTDILSFADADEDSLGELVICFPQIQKQAQEHGLTIQQELAYMLIHGVLHLLGYDHEQSKKEAKLMFALQDRIFEQSIN